MINKEVVLKALNEGKGVTRKVTVLPKMYGNQYLTNNGNELVEKNDIYKEYSDDMAWYCDEHYHQKLIRRLNNDGLYSVTSLRSWNSEMSNQIFFTGITVDLVQL